jgi:hypothetical protein
MCQQIQRSRESSRGEEERRDKGIEGEWGSRRRREEKKREDR